MSVFSIQINDLALFRESKRLVSNLTVDLQAGQMLQVLGPNGAGKTTLLRMLAGLYDDYTGSARILGEPELLYIGHKPGIKGLLTPRENLKWLTKLCGELVDQQQIDKALDIVGLYGYEDTRCHDLSAGQQRRVALAQLYCSQANLWILDEPFTALDQAGIRALEARFLEHCQGGGILLLSSHQALSESLPVNLLNLEDFYSQEAFSG